MKFQLQSKFKPQGDQPTAIKGLVEGLNNKEKGQVLLGATGTGKTFTMANIIAETQRPALIMCHNKTLAAQLASEFQSFFPNNAVAYFVSYYDYYQPEVYIANTDTYIEKETSINEEIDKHRHAATHSLMTRDDVIIVASVSAIYGLGDVKHYHELAVHLQQGQEYTRDSILKDLNNIQYLRALGEFKRGMFNVLGDVVEIYPPSGDNIYRLEFFGDELERIEEADAFTGESLGEVKEVYVYPASHAVTTRETIDRAIPHIMKDMEERYTFFMKNGMVAQAERIKTRTEYDIEMLRETGYCSGIENYVRYLNNSETDMPPQTLLDYFPKDFLMFIDESHMTIPQIRGMFNGNFIRKENLIKHGFRLPSAYDNRPLKFEEFEKYMKSSIFVSATPKDYEFEYSKNKMVEQIIRPTGLLDPKIILKDSATEVEDVVSEIKKRIKKNERVLITTVTKKMAEKMSTYLEENNIKSKYLHSEVDTLDRVEVLRELRLGGENKGIDVVVGVNLLREGLDLPEVSLVAVFDADKAGFLRSRDALIQVAGRAARHLDGTVIFYSRYNETTKKLNITPAMKDCIDETKRRREIQDKFNKDRGVTPQAIKKAISDIAESRPTQATSNKKYDKYKLNKEHLETLLQDLNNQMEIAIENMEFEKAAELRDEIDMLKDQK